MGVDGLKTEPLDSPLLRDRVPALTQAMNASKQTVRKGCIYLDSINASFNNIGGVPFLPTSIVKAEFAARCRLACFRRFAAVEHHLAGQRLRNEGNELSRDRETMCGTKHSVVNARDPSCIDLSNVLGHSLRLLVWL
jgi:hypothetical protein